MCFLSRIVIYPDNCLYAEHGADVNRYSSLMLIFRDFNRRQYKRPGIKREVAVTYSSGTSSSSVSVQTDLADLTETDFGLQLLGLIKLYSRSVYVP